MNKVQFDKTIVVQIVCEETILYSQVILDI